MADAFNIIEGKGSLQYSDEVIYHCWQLRSFSAAGYRCCRETLALPNIDYLDELRREFAKELGIDKTLISEKYETNEKMLKLTAKNVRTKLSRREYDLCGQM